MVENLIERTRQILIAQHGESKVETINGYKHRIINEYYEAFNRFENVFMELIKKTNFPIEDYKDEFELVLRYFEDCEYCEIDAITKVFNKRNNSNSEWGLKDFKRKLKHFFEDVGDILNEYKLNASKVRVAFNKNFGVLLTTNNEYLEKHIKSLKNYYQKF